MKRLTHIFKNSDQLIQAQKTLLARGYQSNEIKINHLENQEIEKGDLVQFENSGNATLRKSIKGLKSGIILGAGIVGLIVGLILLFSESGYSLSPIATFITSIAVGAVWGGVLGFMLGSLFPLDSHDPKNKNFNPKNFSIDFLPHTEEDEIYFKGKWRTAY